MQKLTSSVAIVLVVAGAAMTASAADRSRGIANEYFQSPHALRGGVGGFPTGWEAGEGFVVGPLPQGGWALGAGDAGYDVTFSNKNGSPNSLFQHKNPLAAQGNAQLAFSPLNTDSSRTSVSFDFKMDDAAGANYAVVGQAPSQSFLTWRVEFDYGGTILVVDFTDEQQTTIGFVDTGLAWAGFDWDNFQVDLVGGQIEYRRNGALFYTGAQFAGSLNEQIVLRHDNFQDFTGNTSISGGPIGAYIDNINIQVPTPGAMALLGLGGLVAARRRRA